MEVSHIFALILLIAGAVAYPQFPSWNSPQNMNPNTFITGQPVTPTVSTTTPQPTTASPRYLACIQSCPATSEYNPICGSDNINYYNSGRFNCAVLCGRNVRNLHLGICSTT
ncbi:uncharacterized protein LOC6567123 [Drosophila grimshawi]|uniref:uncharacterized protein LOC6567123 n=1 Tax=Drosophila grimshawi TaxID=7222 RepID=UPI000C870C49|nr:uncharacterized protein LOC6567123 [Drosophila grimshawi]